MFIFHILILNRWKWRWDWRNTMNCLKGYVIKRRNKEISLNWKEIWWLKQIMVSLMFYIILVRCTMHFYRSKAKAFIFFDFCSFCLANFFFFFGFFQKKNCSFYFDAQAANILTKINKKEMIVIHITWRIMLLTFKRANRSSKKCIFVSVVSCLLLFFRASSVLCWCNISVQSNLLAINSIVFVAICLKMQLSYTKHISSYHLPSSTSTFTSFVVTWHMHVLFVWWQDSTNMFPFTKNNYSIMYLIFSPFPFPFLLFVVVFFIICVYVCIHVCFCYHYPLPEHLSPWSTTEEWGGGGWMGGVNKRRIKGVERSGRAVYTSVECGVCVAEWVCGVQWSSKPMRGVLCCGCVGDMRWCGSVSAEGVADTRKCYSED